MNLIGQRWFEAQTERLSAENRKLADQHRAATALVLRAWAAGDDNPTLTEIAAALGFSNPFVRV